MLPFATLLLQAAASAACPATPAPLPPGWSASPPLIATADAPRMLAIGQSARASLAPAAGVKLPAASEKPAASGTNAGVFAFTVPSAGRYRISLSAGVWIDVIAAGKPVASVAHGHGPACSPVRKMVDFDLNAGRHLLQIVGSAGPSVDLLIAPVR